MTKSVLQKILIRLVFLASGIVLSSQVWGQGWDAIYANQTEGIRLRQMNGSQSKDSLSVKTTSNSLIWNSWGIGQTSEKFLNTKSGYTFDIETQFVGYGRHFIQEDNPEPIGRGIVDWYRRNFD